MPAVPDAAKVAEKWGRRTSGATQEYEDGVKSPKRDWAQNTAKASDAYAAGVQAAVSEGRFNKGVTKAGTGKWQTKTATLGVQRWPQGVRAAEADFNSAVAPYLETIKSTTLPARGRRGDPKNLERVRVMAEALHNKKVKG